VFAKAVNRLARVTMRYPQLLEPSGPLGWQLHRRFGRLDRKLARQYLGSSTVRKLHIGCGTHLLIGWLNSDFLPSCPKILHLDATQPFPFEDGTFDYIFTEHMIEHISYQAGQNMLRECRRVLNENGRIRISTPTLSFLFDLYQGRKSGLQIDYIKWAMQLVEDDVEENVVFIINNFMRNWGHTFIYDEDTLRQAMTEAGFVSIVRCSLQESEHLAFRNIENESRMPPGLLRLESVTLEARKSR
jgi:predicted SAM-dependent methyltransferase